MTNPIDSVSAPAAPTSATSTLAASVSGVSAESPDSKESGEEFSEWDREYQVVRLRPQPMTLAYVCFVSVFVWFEVYRRVIRAGWPGMLLGGVLISAVGAIAGIVAWRRRRTFAALVSMLLSVGIFAAIIVPITAGLLVYFRPG